MNSTSRLLISMTTYLAFFNKIPLCMHTNIFFMHTVYLLINITCTEHQKYLPFKQLWVLPIKLINWTEKELNLYLYICSTPTQWATKRLSEIDVETDTFFNMKWYKDYPLPPNPLGCCINNTFLWWVDNFTLGLAFADVLQVQVRGGLNMLIRV